MKKRIPPRPDLGHLKKQAKALLSAYRAGDPAACARLCDTLPAARGRPVAAIASLDLRLHDAQSCIAREYGLASWTELKDFVLARQAQSADPAAAALQWLRFVYAGDIAGGTNRARPSVAAQLLEDNPMLRGADPWLACAIGDEAMVRQTLERDRAWVQQPGGPLQLPPLVAVTHSSLLRLPAFRDGLRACARLLLAAGADPNQSVGNRWPPASLAAPDEAERLSALYGAAGQNHDADLTKLLLDAGADPNDGESLYHSLENIACTQALLEAGARVVGTNALHRVLDLDRLESLQLLLSHGADPNEPIGNPAATDWHTPLLWAIRRRRSPSHIEALLAAGADPSIATPGGVTAVLLAQRFGLPEIAGLLRRAGSSPPSSLAEEFIAACARGDEAAALALHSAHPGVIDTLSESQLKLLPELAAEGCGEAVRLMVRLGWPVATRGGDLDGSALNQAVFRGDASLARFLLEHGASWREAHGYGDNVIGSLSWASLNEPVEGGDWLGCAEALAGHGMPLAQPDPQDSTSVLIDGRRKWFSDEVSDYLLGIG